MEVKRSGDASGSYDPANFDAASIAHDPKSSFSRLLVDDAVRYREIGRHDDALAFASKAAAILRDSNVCEYSRAIVEIAKALESLGEPGMALLALEAGWKHAEKALDRAMPEPDGPRTLLEMLGAAYAHAGDAARAESCFENSKLFFGSRSSAHAESSVALGVGRLLDGELERAREHFASALSEAARKVVMPLRTVALAEVGQGIVLWLEGYEDGLQYIASGMNRARHSPTLEAECRKIAYAVSTLLAGTEKDRAEALEEIRHAVS